MPAADDGPRGAAPAIEVRNLTFRYPGAERDTLRGVDLTIAAGDFVAVVGGNGSGKTTLAKTFNGLVPHFWNGDLSGSVRVHGRGTRKRSVAELASEVGFVFQDFGNQLVRPTVRDDVAYAPLNLGRADWRERADAAVAGLGLEPIADTFTWQLSGGQQHLTALAGALALAPRILVVDEPAAEVDPARAAEIYEHLVRLNERGTTVVVVEHHAELIARYARSVVLVDDGVVRWHLPTAEAMARREDLESADVPAPQVVEIARALAPGSPLPLTVDDCVAALALLADPLLTPPAEAAASRDAALPRRSTEAGSGPESGSRSGFGGASDGLRNRAGIASLRDVSHGYLTIDGPRSTVVDGLSLDLFDDDRVALVGSNGAGKSTLLTLLAGLALPRAGTVTVDGRDTREVSAPELAGTVCYLVQHPEEMFLQDSVAADVAMFPRGRRVAGADELVARVLDRMDLTGVADRDGRLLSGGQQRRATLAIALAMRPRLLLLDEPTASLDLRSRDDVIGLLADLAEHIRCTVVATHDMQLVAEWATRVVVLDGGRIIADTTPAALFADDAVLARARLVPPQAAQVGRRLGLSPVPRGVAELVARLGGAPAEAASPAPDVLSRPAESGAAIAGNVAGTVAGGKEAAR